MDIIVTGGRGYADVEKVKAVLRLFDFSLLVHGGCTGADMLARDYANENGITFHTEYVDWSDGKMAGPRRNRKMLDDFPNAVVIAFPGGRGTANCVAEALKRKMIVLRVD